MTHKSCQLALLLGASGQKNRLCLVALLKVTTYSLFLYGLSHVGRDSRDIDAINAFRAFCLQVASGLEHFLDRARPYRELQLQTFFLYVWDADEMATLVEQSPFAAEFAWYADQLRTDPVARKFVQDRCNA